MTDHKQESPESRHDAKHQVDELVSCQDYAYATIEEYEKITGFQVNEAFRIGWDMARVTNKQLRALAGN